MYEEFFGLSETPFSLTPNTHFFLKSRTHQQGLEMLLVALDNREGFIKVSGEVGTGKTLLCRKLLNALDDKYVTAYIPNPYFSAETLYCMVADELGASISHADEGKSITEERHVLALKQINESLIHYAEQGKQVVLIIDEAQAMPEDTIEALRLLTNLETESNKLMQVVLFGQPELDDMLNQNNMRQLQQRITFQHKIAPFTREDIEHYISHRMILAGYNGGRLFDVKAISLLTKASGGIPRLINILCHKSLMLAYGQGQRCVSAKYMKAAIEDTESVKSNMSKVPKWRFWQRSALALLVSLVVPLSQNATVLGSSWL